MTAACQLTMSHVTNKMAAMRVKTRAAPFLSLLCLFLSLSLAKCDRKLTTVYNPGCDIPECMPQANGTALNVGYVKAAGPNDTLHYLISSVGIPALVVLRTNPGPGAVHIDWKTLNQTGDISGSITFSEKVLYSFGVAFTKLYEYNDVSDSANMDFDKNETDGRIHLFEEMIWDGIADQKEMAAQNVVVLNTSLSMNNNTSFMNGSLYLKFTVYNHTARNLDALPHLLYNDNMTQLDFALDHVTPSFASSRFGLGMVVVSEDKTDTVPTEFETDQSIDDEYTPGVFKITNWVTSKAKNRDEAFVQWKPVCYVNPSRGRADATYVRTYNLLSKDADTQKSLPDLKTSILYAYYGPRLTSKALAIRLTNVSFGLSKDGWYPKTNYTIWTANIGYGSPPMDTISVLVIGIISAGLGLPILIILFGGVFVCIKKRKNKDSLVTETHSGAGYSSINS